MTTRKYSVVESPYNVSRLVIWENLLNGESGEPYESTHFADRTLQVTGTFDGAVTLQGSNDGTNYSILTNNLGDNLSYTAAGMDFVVECPKYVKPVVAAGSTALIKASLFVNGERA